MPVNKFLMVCLVSLALVACKKEKQADVADVADKIDPLAMESELRILGLNGRIESGKNNADIDWVSPFQDATGCKVKATMVENQESLDASLGNADFDLVITSDMALPVEKLAPLETARLRSFKDLDKRFFVPQSRSRKFSLPFQWQLIKPVPPATEFTTQVESIHLMANAKNINCAYAWMEWSLSPKLQGDVAAALGTIPVVPAACIGNETLGDDACRERMSETVEPVSEEATEKAPADVKTL